MNISLKKRTFLILLAGLTATFASAQEQPLPEWQSQYAVGLNKLAPHTYVWPYANASDIEKPGGYEQSPFYMTLNGKWKFHWVKNPDNRPKDFYQPSYYTGGWADINVPGNWERQGYGTAIYVNETYEFDDKMFNFKKNPPLVPYAENEVGSYRRTFKVPADWKGRRVVLCCEGVISFYYVWVNGKLLGYNQGSKTNAEWDITDVLNDGENVVALEVYRWSAGAYLECQDMWRLSGIERDVYLYSTPKQYIADYKLNASLDKDRYKDGIFGLEVTVEGPSSTTGSIAYTLKDDSGKALGSQSQIGMAIAPKDTVVLTSLMDTGDAAASSVEIKAKKPKFTTQKVVNSKNFTTANITEVPQEYTCPKVTGEVTYNGKEDLDGIAITAVYILGDKSVYAYTTYLQSIESESTESFEINPISTELPDHDSVEVYVQNW